MQRVRKTRSRRTRTKRGGFLPLAAIIPIVTAAIGAIPGIATAAVIGSKKG